VVCVIAGSALVKCVPFSLSTACEECKRRSCQSSCAHLPDTGILPTRACIPSAMLAIRVCGESSRDYEVVGVLLLIGRCKPLQFIAPTVRAADAHLAPVRGSTMRFRALSAFCIHWKQPYQGICHIPVYMVQLTAESPSRAHKYTQCAGGNHLMRLCSNMAHVLSSTCASATIAVLGPSMPQ
jgi:hypothetical protein